MSDDIIPGELHRMLARTRNKFSKRAAPRLNELGITRGQPRVLHYLTEHAGCAQKDIAVNYDLEPATVTEILNSMEKKGLIRREHDESDRRVLRVFLTRQGSKLNDQVSAAFCAVEDVAFKGFSARERKQAVEILRRMSENLK